MKFLNPEWHDHEKKYFWGAAIAAGVSLIEGQRAASRAKKAAKAADARRKEILANAQKNYDNWKAQYGAVEADLIESIDQFTVRDNLQKYMEQGVVDVATAQQKAQDIQKRQMTRYGLDPSDPRYQQSEREIGIDRARMEVEASDRARTRAEEERIEDEDKLFSRQLAVSKFGRSRNPMQEQLASAQGIDLGYLTEQEKGYAEQASTGYGLTGKLAGKAISDYGKTDGYSSTPGYDFDTPDYGTGTMTDDYGEFSSGDLGW